MLRWVCHGCRHPCWSAAACHPANQMSIQRLSPETCYMQDWLRIHASCSCTRHEVLQGNGSAFSTWSAKGTKKDTVKLDLQNGPSPCSTLVTTGAVMLILTLGSFLPPM